VLVLLIIAASLVSNVILAQQQSDITVVGIVNTAIGVPGCTLSDGGLKIYNTSETYEYRVWIDWRAENDSYGNARCGTGCPNATKPCECGDETLYDVGVDTSVVPDGQCEFPVCSECTYDCDNENSPCSYDHCICLYGTYAAAYYREPPDLDWTLMPPSYPTYIAATERDENCPGDPETVCGY
jgi:hypothetical protein